ncbi:MAG: trigger factor [Pseudomonadota bacterium]
MQVSLESVGTLERKLTVRFPAEQVESRARARIVELGRTVRIKGFRPGKVPPRVLEQRFGAQVRSEAMSEAISASYLEALRQQTLRPVMAPSISARAAEGNEIEYVATFEVVPELPPIDVSGLQVTRTVSAVEEDDVDRMIETLRQQRRQWQVVERPAAAGDMVIFEYAAVADGVRHPAEGFERAGTILGAGALFAEFEPVLLGAVAGDSRSATVQFPANFREPSLGGRAAAVDARVVRVQHPALPEVDDAFIASFGVRDGGMARFRADVRANLERELNAAVRGRTKAEAVSKLMAAWADLEVPRSLVDTEADGLLKQAQQNAQRAGVQPPADASLFRKDAENRVRAFVLLGEIARQNRISPDPQRVNEMLATIASTYEEPEKVVELYARDPELMATLRNRVVEDQVVDWVLDHARVAEQRLSFAELMQPQG